MRERTPERVEERPWSVCVRAEPELGRSGVHLLGPALLLGRLWLRTVEQAQVEQDVSCCPESLHPSPWGGAGWREEPGKCRLEERSLGVQAGEGAWGVRAGGEGLGAAGWRRGPRGCGAGAAGGAAGLSRGPSSLSNRGKLYKWYNYWCFIFADLSA